MSKKSIAKEAIKRIIEPSVVPLVRPKPPKEKPTYADRKLVCPGCGTEWVWLAEEQRFFADKGLNKVPKWCPPCRKNRRQYFMDHPTITRKQ